MICPARPLFRADDQVSPIHAQHIWSEGRDVGPGVIGGREIADPQLPTELRDLECVHVLCTPNGRTVITAYRSLAGLRAAIPRRRRRRLSRRTLIRGRRRRRR